LAAEEKEEKCAVLLFERVCFVPELGSEVGDKREEGRANYERAVPIEMAVR